MGACLTADKNTKFIESKLKEQEKYEESVTKLLFLGPGGSGKSTIFKQLQWLHGNEDGGYTEKEIILLRQQINDQIICQMKCAINHYLSDETYKIDDRLQNAMNIVKCYNDSELIPEITDSISYIWRHDDRLNEIFQKHDSNKILDETTEYFWNEIDRISSIDYIPNKKDIINLRNRTTGIIEKKFTIRDSKFHIFDVGGQKSERKKWIKCFDNVKALVFVVSLSCFNENMYEDKKKNSMIDAMELFHKTINDNHFDQTPIILFLNKKDLFEIKIKELPITICPAFDDFDGNDPNNFDETTSFIVNKFTSINNKQRTIFAHLTCAMDQKNIENVFNDVTKIILKNIKQNMVNAL